MIWCNLEALRKYGNTYVRSCTERMVQQSNHDQRRIQEALDSSTSANTREASRTLIPSTMQARRTRT